MIGVLSLQGGFALHLELVRRLGYTARTVRAPADLQGIDGLIIPGGESTTIGFLLRTTALYEAILACHADGMAIYGTCAGAIVMAREIAAHDQPSLKILDLSVTRNAYGTQIQSAIRPIVANTETSLYPLCKQFIPSRGMFIRAPIINRYGDGVEVLAWSEDHPVIVQQGNLLAATFHPELRSEVNAGSELHDYFAKYLCKS